MTATVHVVDDDASWRKSVARLLSTVGHRVVQYESAGQFLETAELDAPGCILLDMHMPEITGLQLQQRLAGKQHALPTVFVSGHGDIPTSVLAMKAGAENFLTKPVEKSLFFGAVDNALKKDQIAKRKARENEELTARYRSLTPREQEVLPLLVSGLLNKQAAAELGITEYTVQIHRGNIMRKMKADSFASLVRMAGKLNPDESERG